jgi:hypothetical protein
MNVFHLFVYDSPVNGITRRSGVRRALMALGPGAIAARLLPGQAQVPPDGPYAPGVQPGVPRDVRLPNGKLQRDEILKAEYAQNLKDARELSELARTFELDLEKSDRFVLSLSLLKRLDEMEKLTKRIRGRMKR